MITVNNETNLIEITNVGQQGATGIVDWGGIESVENLIQILSEKVDISQSNITIFNNVNAVEIPYDDFRNVPIVNVFIEKEDSTHEKAEANIEYVLPLKKVIIDFSGHDESGYVIFS